MDLGQLCTRCVLTTRVPGVTLDEEGVCNVCNEYDAHKGEYDGYFKTEADLVSLMEDSKREDAEYDILLMYSGGKDSTYVLYRMHDMGYRILALTFDNGYIPKGCFDNIKGVCEDIGVDTMVVSVPKARMDRAFAIDLKENNTVCGACFRGLTARGTELAIQKNIPIMMTGLSRGQIYDTKVHALVRRGITDPVKIDRHLNQSREVYHAKRDEIGELIDDHALDDREGFRRVQFIDYYRYCLASKSEIIELIQGRAPFWRKPENVGGCSTNCMINDVGIQVHLDNKGFHNYAIPAAWEIRFGHLTRDQALDELRGEFNATLVDNMIRKLEV